MNEVVSQIECKKRPRCLAGHEAPVSESRIKGWYQPGDNPLLTEPAAIREAVLKTGLPFYVVMVEGGPGIGIGGRLLPEEESTGDGYPLLAWVPGITPLSLGDSDFLKAHGASCPCVAGSMAHGISSPEMIKALAQAGILGFFGTAGLAPAMVESLILDNKEELQGKPHGFNIIHSPGEPALEEAIINLYIRRGVSLVEASAFMGVTLPLVRFRVRDIRQDAHGKALPCRSIMAKVSRVEVARQFMSPPPEEMLKELVSRGEITGEQASMAREIPLACDITLEADSGGHTDNRPAISLMPTMTALRDRLQEEYSYGEPLRIGLGGGISTPVACAGAFSMGASYVVTGSVNQACMEAGTSDGVRELLSQARQGDMAMAPAADMFEMGVRVQVLKRGTMFAMRARKLYDLYNSYNSFDQIPISDRQSIEKTFFRASFDEIWHQTKEFFRMRDPSQGERGDRELKHRMALVFRWYLSQASHWAISGEPSRRMDYQIWCGPAMGAFNEWTEGTFLEQWRNRRVVNVNRNIIHGASVVARLNFLKMQGVDLYSVARPVPLTDEELDKYSR